MKRRMILVLLLLGLSLAILASAAVFAIFASEQFGASYDITFVRHSARFQGATSWGVYDVTFERIAPASPSRGTGTLLMGSPQCALAALGGGTPLGESPIVPRNTSGEFPILLFAALVSEPVALRASGREGSRAD